MIAGEFGEEELADPNRQMRLFLANREMGMPCLESFEVLSFRGPPGGCSRLYIFSSSCNG
jgi:hypothetical protein